ncbi:hypothetical protein Catovirus_1_328 [Catovirus CTV1]|uniref:Uncharacterized protein n=1 Tax=Catovirus CTV1 TaxID=1977631 RepID=A0A1V0S9F0_9VIRU|nr:hypothetical protein Catovirus_1_328 [Catovirus CTV1]
MEKGIFKQKYIYEKPENKNFKCELSVSNDGTNIFSVFCGNNSDNVAELLRYHNDGLTIIKKINKCENYPYIQSGYASKNFKKFSILDYDENHDNARLRIFDSKLDVILTKEFLNYKNSNSFFGGCFTEDEKYVILIHYKQQLDDISTFTNGLIEIYDSSNLNLITSLECSGIFYISPKTFSLKTSNSENIYIILPLVDSIVSKQSPYYLSVYSFNNNILKYVTKYQLPQELISYDISVKRIQYAYIGIGTKRADLTSEKIVDSRSIKSVNDDGNEYKLLRFKDEKLKIVFEKKFQSNVAVSLSKNMHYALINQHNYERYKPNIDYGSLCIHTLNKERNYQLMKSVFDSKGYYNICSKFSEDCSRLIICGNDDSNFKLIIYNINDTKL